MKQHFLLIMFVTIFVAPVVIMTVQHLNVFDGLFDVCTAIKSSTTAQDPSCSTTTTP